MKCKLLQLLLAVLLIAVPVRQVVAATPTATATATPTASTSAKLEELKDRLATKVAELRDVVRRAITGNIKVVSISSATVETKTKDVKIELSDDIVVSQIINGKRTVLSVEDVAKDDHVTVFGSYDATLDLLKAKAIFIESNRVIERATGTVTDVDRDEGTIIIHTPEDTTITVDIEKATKTMSWTQAGGVAKAGFSKIVTGDTVHVSGTAVPKKENRISALRILDLGTLSDEAKPTMLPTATLEATPSATSKITPKATVKPTAKPTVKPTP